MAVFESVTGAGAHASAERSAGRAANPPWWKGYRRVLLLADLGAAMLAAAVGYIGRFGTDATPTETVVYGATVLVFPPLWVLALGLGRSYEPRFLGVGSEEFRRVVAAALAVIAAVGTASWAFELDTARGFVVLTLPFATLLTLVQRYSIRKALHRRRLVEYDHRVLVVGHAGPAADLVRQMRSARYHGMHVVGACLPQPTSDTELADLAVPVLGTFDEIAAAVEHSESDTVAVVSCPEMDGAALRRLGWALEDSSVDLVLAPSLIETVGPRIAIRPVCGLPLLHVERPELTGVRRLAKAAVDRVGAALALALLSPLLLALAVLVRLDSRGPAVFRQRRVGLDGREFQMLKFRTMVVGAERMVAAGEATEQRGNEVLFKLRHDPRVTRVGRRLRRHSLDELPQLVNVLRGEMSLVGPRPPLPSEVAAYMAHVHRRLLVKPGLTGLWQINGRSDLDWEESVRLDLRYVENWSFAFDVMILWKTASAVLRGRGAY